MKNKMWKRRKKLENPHRLVWTSLRNDTIPLQFAIWFRTFPAEFSLQITTFENLSFQNTLRHKVGMARELNSAVNEKAYARFNHSQNM